MNEDLVHLMEENLARVWSERDATNRIKAIQHIYKSDSSLYLYHVGHQTKGHEAINESVSNVLANMPETSTFLKLQPVVIKNNIGRLIWGRGANKHSITATGMDVALFKDGKIKSLYVFFD